MQGGRKGAPGLSRRTEEFAKWQGTVNRARVAREEAQVGALFTISSINLEIIGGRGT